MKNFSATGAKAWMERRPLLVMAAVLPLNLVVPLIAKIAGNEDPMKNSISHVFGQQSICVAMDFPGWMEAATVVFFLTGLTITWAVMQVYRYIRQRKTAQGEDASPAMLAVVGFQIVTCNCLWMLGLFNPTRKTDSTTVILHTVPYLLQFYSRPVWLAFLAWHLPLFDTSRRFRVMWCCASTFVFALCIYSSSTIIWSFVEMHTHNISDPMSQPHEWPTERMPTIAVTLTEYLALPTFVTALFLHPLGILGTHCSDSGDSGSKSDASDRAGDFDLNVSPEP
jgi:hypothetical protein